MNAMIATSDTLAGPRIDATTERFDPVACVSSRDRRRAVHVEPGEPGRYIQVRGPDQSLLIPLGDDVLHVGRGLVADLQLDDISVSRRHAIILQRESGARIMDDRSLNGTFVNGRRIDSVDLRSGDVITLGRCELCYLDA
jgi:pSer/pThr/pTyr-binding forkhead associated (FHA) protein